MTRRSAIDAIAVLLSAPIIGRLLSGRTFYGPITVDRYETLRRNGLRLRVFYEGVDVTKRCEFVDDTPGHERAVLLNVDGNGRFFFDPSTNSASRETVRGASVQVRQEGSA